MDALFEAVQSRGPVCAGLDTAIEYLPAIPLGRSPAAAILDYNKAVIDATADVCACYKVQIACYEALGIAGLETYRDTLRYIRERGSLCIADIKRGDIADTAVRYADAHFSGEFEADFVTLSPYMGMDSIRPWFKHALTAGKGAFVLLRTSNEGASDFEWAALQNGDRLYHVVGDRLSALAEDAMGAYGYGAFGAVAGCTDRREAAELRGRYRNLFLLIPGYGAQGGGAEDAATLLEKGNGGVVNASRSLLCAWKTRPSGKHSLADAAEAAREAACVMRDAIQAASRALESRAPV
jgi:orotidine-5'-phosphate decarboxylase